MVPTAHQKKFFFNLPNVKRRLSARPDGDLRHDQVTIIADGLGVTEQEVIEMNRRLSGDVSLNTPLNDNGDSIEWQDRLADQGSDRNLSSGRVMSWRLARRRWWRHSRSLTAQVYHLTRTYPAN